MKTIRERQCDRCFLRGVNSRSGVTLTEVLMSLMIMSIGVVGVATLFPISTVRTLEANKNTNATIARFVAEGIVDVDPSLIHNPDGNFPSPASTDTTPYNGPAFRGQNYLVDPLGWQMFNQDAPAAATPLLSASSSARDYFGNPTSSSINTSMPRRYNGASQFPYAAGTISAYPNPSSQTELKNALSRAAQIVNQPDNWKLVTESAVIATGTTTGVMSVQLDNDGDLTSINSADLTATYPTVAYRAVIFDSDGKHSEIRPVSAITLPDTVTWASSLPSRFDSGNIGKVRIEQSDEIYTWMLSVRKRSSGSANVDVVVFFKRSFKPEHEYAYGAAFRTYTLGADNQPGKAGVDDNQNGTTDEVAEIGFPNTDDQPNNVVTIDFTGIPAGSDTPNVKRGSFVYDTRNGLWYRIRKVQNETATSIDLVLDEAIKKNNTEDLNWNNSLNAGEDANNDGTLQQGGAILNPTVVNVFPLEIKEP